MKKLMALFMAFTLVLSMVAFSGALASAAEFKPMELVIAFPYVNKAPTDITMVEDAISKITKERFNATVKLMPIAFSAWSEQFNLLMAGNEQVDLICSSFSNTSLSTKVGMGYLLELDDLMEQYGKELSDVLGGYIVGGQVNGVTYAVPTMRDLASSAGMMFIKSYIDKYNIDLSKVKSWEDMTPILATLKEGEGKDFYPMYLNSTQYSSFTSTFSDALGDSLGTLEPSSTTGKVVNRFELEAYRKIVELVRSWYEAGYINMDAATTQVTWLEAAKAKTAACWPNNTKPGQAVNQSNMVGDTIVSVTIGDAEVYTSSLQAAMWSIPYQTADPARAMMMMNLMFSDVDIFNLLCWGIEGVHYVKTDDGHINYPQGVTAENTGWGINIGWLLGNQFLSYYWVGNPLDYWDQMKTFNDAAKVSIASGFVFDSTTVKNEMAACQAVLNEYRIAIETGSVDLVKLDEMNKKMYASGLQAIIDEKQKQLDAFLKAK